MRAEVTIGRWTMETCDDKSACVVCELWGLLLKMVRGGGEEKVDDAVVEKRGDKRTDHTKTDLMPTPKHPHSAGQRNCSLDRMHFSYQFHMNSASRRCAVRHHAHMRAASLEAYLRNRSHLVRDDTVTDTTHACTQRKASCTCYLGLRQACARGRQLRRLREATNACRSGQTTHNQRRIGSCHNRLVVRAFDQ